MLIQLIYNFSIEQNYFLLCPAFCGTSSGPSTIFFRSAASRFIPHFLKASCRHTCRPLSADCLLSPLHKTSLTAPWILPLLSHKILSMLVLSKLKPVVPRSWSSCRFIRPEIRAMCESSSRARNK